MERYQESILPNQDYSGGRDRALLRLLKKEKGSLVEQLVARVRQ